MTRRTITVGVTTVIVAVGLALALVGLSDRSRADSDGATRHSFAVLGDSYAVGYGAGNGNGWVEQFATRMCWSLINRSAQGGTGYTNAGQKPEYAAFGQRVSAVTTGNPAVLFVEGGTNDERASSEQITRDAAAVFAAIKAQVPDNTLVVAVGPIRTPKKDPDNMARVSDAISQAANEANVRFIDPVGQRWVDGDSLFFDAYHPNDAGYNDFARHLAQDMQELGVTSDC